MFGTLGRWTYRRRWYIVGVWLAVLVVALGMASKLGKVLGPGEFRLQGSDSEKARAVLNQQFNQDDRKVLLVVMAGKTAVSDPTFQRAVHETAARIRADRPLQVQFLDDPTVSHNRQLISKDGHAVTLMVSSRLQEPDLEKQVEHLRHLVRNPGYTTYLTGTAAANHDGAIQSQKDIQKGDSITIPIMVVILLLVFGSLVAAGLPLLLAIFSVSLSLALVYVAAHFVSASIYVENVVMFIGLGVSIDYSLFILYRFREELQAAHGDRETAVVRTMETTGRAIFFSGITVAIGLASLTLTGLSFMISMGLGGIIAPLSALLASLTLLPALLSILGHKVNRFRVIPSRFLRTGESRGWHRLAQAIMRKPIVTGGAVLVVLLAIAFPVTQLGQAYGGLKNAPRGLESIQGFVYMKYHFPSTPDPTQVVIEHTGSGTLLRDREVAAMRSLETALKRNPGAASVVGPTDFLPAHAASGSVQSSPLVSRYLSPDLRYALFTVVPKHEVGTAANDDLTRSLRATTAGFEAGSLRGSHIYVGGAGPSYLDYDKVMLDKFPLIIVLVLILTYAFLFFAFRSVFLPLKAVLLNLLSVGAAYGVLQLVFQRGVGSHLLGFTPEDGVAAWVPVFLFAFLFGLSMDYEVFLLSRIRERWQVTGDNRDSVAFGLERTGRLITSAALIMVVAFSGLAIGQSIDMKEFGLGLVASIALDATLIRVVLVPAIMSLMGRWNWWMPGFLEGFAGGGGFSEGEVEPVEALAA